VVALTLYVNLTRLGLGEDGAGHDKGAGVVGTRAGEAGDNAT